MNISNESGIRKLDIDLVNFFFNTKSAMLESLEDHKSGMFSTQQKLMEIKGQLLDFLMSHENSIFYIFFNEQTEENLKIVVSSVMDEPDELTKRFAILIDESSTELRIEKLSLSSKVLITIKGNHERVSV
jgi:hypothetical protein